MNIVAKLGVAVAAAALAACSPSGYSVQARNNLAQPVELRMMAQKKDSEARMLQSWQVAPGANNTTSTMADHDEKVTLEARVAGDTASPPAVYKMIVGLSRVVIGPNPEAEKDEKQAKVRIREERN